MGYPITTHQLKTLTQIGQQQFAGNPSNTLPSLHPASKVPSLSFVSPPKGSSSRMKLAQYVDKPLQWQEWFGQFCSTVDAASLSDDVKLTYLTVLVTAKDKSAIAEFAYSEGMYMNDLKCSEKKLASNKT